jgi:hypothetical protein
VATGVLTYFPDAIREVAHVSYVGNQQHNSGQPMHWNRSKSQDHADCLARHLIERGTIDTDGLRHTAKVAWRALALLQIELEEAAPTADRREQVVADKMTAAFGAPPTGKGGTFTPISETLKAAAEVFGTPPILDREEEQELQALWEAEIAEAIEDEAFEETDSDASTPYSPTYYIAGPMRGYPDFNFPAFDAAKRALGARGYQVISPADMDRMDPQIRVADALPQHVYAKRDTSALIALAEDNDTFGLKNGIYMLRGWERSKGARAEHALAEWLGLEIVYQISEEV